MGIRLKWLSTRAAVSFKSKYCYFRIPKCANSTIVSSLAFHDENIEYIESNNKRNEAHEIKKQFDRIPTKEIPNIEEYIQDLFLFTFVRNPYTRLLSCYFDKIKENSFDNKYIRILTKKDKFGKMKFEDFIFYLENGGLYKNPHWVPQHKMISVDVEKLDFIGKTERIEEDLKQICLKLFGEYKGLKLANIGKNSHKYNGMYNEDLKNRVYNLYKKDFKLFKYKKRL